MITQSPKQLIDIGIIGNASTGDILYDGGKKINEDFNQVYNTFGDQRLVDTPNQILHATGYYQKMPQISDWAREIPLGSMIDVDTSYGNVSANIAKGKQGECVVFVNSNGSISKDNFFEIQVLDRFVNLSTPNLRVTEPYTKITLWCISDAGGVAVWDYSIESMFGESQVPLDKTYTVSPTPRDITLTQATRYQTVKLLLTAVSADAKRVKTSEVILYVDNIGKKVYSTEYGVLRLGETNDDDEIYSADYSIVGDNIVLKVSAVTNIRLAVKVTDTQSIGAPL